MMARFFRYAEKVFDLRERVGQLKDSRQEPQIPTGSVWLSGLMMFATRRGSLNAIESDLRRPKRLESWVGRHRPSADTLGRVYAQMDSEGLREMLSGINHQIKRNKALGLPKGPALLWLGVDGHELYASRSRCCPMCSRRTITVGGQEVIEYYHRAVSGHLVGLPIALPLDLELLQPGEGETVAARRMLRRVLERYGRFFDGVVGDALYLDAPMFNFCLEHHKHVIAVLKREDSVLLNDARGLIVQSAPVRWEVPGGEIRSWDLEGFNTLQGVKAPIRVLHTEETLTERRRVAGQWVHETKVHQWYWATTVAATAMPTRPLWKAAHSRWDIENDQFNTLSTHWAMDHCFKHDPTAIVNFILTLFVAYVLIQSFYHRNLKPILRRKLTLIALAAELYLGLAQPGPSDPWIHAGSGHPP
jgi:hypothetical protein